MGNVTLTNRATGADEVFDDADLSSALSTGKYIAPQAIAVHRFGEDTFATPQQFSTEKNLDQTIDPTKAVVAQAHQERKTENTGLGSTAKAFGGGLVDSLTLGAVSPWQDAREFNTVASGAGQIAGIVAPMLLGDEAGLANLGRLGEAGEAADVARALDPVAVEHAASGLSSKMLFGGERVGAPAGSAARDLEVGLSKAGAAMDDAQAASAVPDDLAAMSKSDLKGARDAEVAQLDQARGPQRQQFASDLAQFREDTKAAKPFVATMGDDVKGIGQVKQMSKVALDADRAVDKMLNKGTAYLADNLRPALGALQQQENALTRIMASEPELRAAYATDETGTRAQALSTIPKTIERNQELQSRLRELMVPKSELKSPRLTAIDHATDALGIPAPPTPPPSMLENAVKGTLFGAATGAAHAIPVLGQIPGVAPMLGAKLSSLAGDLVFKRMSKAVAASSARTAAAAEAVSAGSKLNIAIPTAMAALKEAKYAAEPAGATTTKEALPAMFKKTSAAIRSQTMYDPTGTPVMTPSARDALARKLAPFRAVSPLLADRIETVAARKVEYLSSQLPRRPDLPTFGPDRWQPSDMAMRSYARKVAAVEDLGGVEERISNGTASPEDIEAYRAVCPARAKAFEAAVMQSVATSKKPVSYEKKLTLSMMTGTPLDPSLVPNIQAVLQSQYAAMPDENGVTQPRALPQFGSVKKSVDQPTPSQARAAGTK